ncbi:MAG: SGNH/GDSL hydrolase family protein [Mangrovibacterium sp.]
MAKITFQDKANQSAITNRPQQVVAEDLNEIKQVVNHNDDNSLAAFKAQVKQYNSAYNGIGFAHIGDATPADVAGNVYQASGNGTIFGVDDVLAGQWLIGTGSEGYSVELLSQVIKENSLSKKQGLINIFDKSTMVVEDTFVDVGGNIVSNAVVNAAKIPVYELTEYAIHNGEGVWKATSIGRLAYLDNSDVKIFSIDMSTLDDADGERTGGKKFTTPTGAAYIILNVDITTHHYQDTLQVQTGTECSSYENYESPISINSESIHDYEALRLAKISVKSTELTDSNGMINLFDKTTMIVKNTYVDSSGNITTNTSVNAALIPILPARTYAIHNGESIWQATSIGRLAVMKADGVTKTKTFDMSTLPDAGGDRTGGKSFTTPTDAAFLLLNVDITTHHYQDTLQVEEGHSCSVLSEYFGISKIKNKLLPPNKDLRYDLSHLIWNALGDSVTWLDDNDTGLAISSGYQSLVKAEIRFKQVRNYGYSGHVLPKGIPGYSSIFDHSGDFEVGEIYTIMAGINAMVLIHDSYLGAESDFINRTGWNTLYGAWREAFEFIYSVNPNAYIIPCTEHYFSSNTDETFRAKYVTINDVTRWCAKKWGLTVADVYSESGINARTLAQCTYDNTHPSYAGFKRISKVVASAIRRSVL